MRLYFLRHGQTQANFEKRYYGITDVGLTDDGVKQATNAGISLKEVEFAHAYSSPLCRARATAEIVLNQNLNEIPKTTIVNEFCEIDFGDWENKTYDEIALMYPKNFASYINDFNFHVFANGQSVKSFYQIVTHGIDNLLSQNLEGNILIVSHLGVIGCALNYLLFGDMKDIFNFVIETGCLAIVEHKYDKNRLLSLG